MGRINIFEFEDQQWFPDMLRNYGTDFLQFLSNKAKIYKPAIPIIKKGLEKCNTHTIIDLASGGGGGLLWLNSQLKKNIADLEIILTDLFPNIVAFKFTESQANNFRHISEPIDAREVPEDLDGMRTMFLAFHHFKPGDAKHILENAISANKGIAIFEVQERSVPSIIAMLLSPVSVFLTTPFIRPFKINRILFTYLIPVVPLFVLWDGVVSALRTYSVKEMRELIDSLPKKDSFDWEIEKIKSGPGVILYLLGTPK